ncbi:hypothetical protein SKAU_G00318710 [Synaphobranchus kaupii]|uniref:Uncharacterized protein n=1 Tax=Synaphobranchus kaupii TaxID=118154 RepID=A0A9Q1ET82_SYNKA|nr:hypothetical protein SKAU_G00318710 [Synaphobranchus kaupii]
MVDGWTEARLHRPEEETDESAEARAESSGAILGNYLHQRRKGSAPARELNPQPSEYTSTVTTPHCTRNHNTACRDTRPHSQRSGHMGGRQAPSTLLIYSNEANSAGPPSH